MSPNRAVGSNSLTLAEYGPKTGSLVRGLGSQRTVSVPKRGLLYETRAISHKTTFFEFGNICLVTPVSRVNICKRRVPVGSQLPSVLTQSCA